MAKGDRAVTVIEWIVVIYLILFFAPRLLNQVRTSLASLAAPRRNLVIGGPVFLTPEASGTLQLDKILDSAGSGAANIVGSLFDRIDYAVE